MSDVKYFSELFLTEVLAVVYKGLSTLDANTRVRNIVMELSENNDNNVHTTHSRIHAYCERPLSRWFSGGVIQGLCGVYGPPKHCEVEIFRTFLLCNVHIA